MKIDRLIGIITILLQQDRITAPELARRFEVSRRTINRDIEDICRAGIPLITLQGYGGGISIADGYKLDKALLNQEELQTILAGLKGIDSVSSTPYQVNLLEKLNRRESRVIADDMIIIDLASQYQKTLTPKIESIKSAISNQLLIRFQYFYKKGEQERLIEPYHLIFMWSSWYVFGFCTKRRAFRMFKLNRLWYLEVTQEAYAPRTIPMEELCFDQIFTTKPLHLKAMFAPTEKYRLIEEYGIDSFETAEDGMLLFEWDFSSYDHMRSWVFSFGDKVRILEPKELYADRLAQARQLLCMEELGD